MDKSHDERQDDAGTALETVHGRPSLRRLAAPHHTNGSLTALATPRSTPKSEGSDRAVSSPLHEPRERARQGDQQQDIERRQARATAATGSHGQLPCADLDAGPPGVSPARVPASLTDRDSLLRASLAGETTAAREPYAPVAPARSGAISAAAGSRSPGAAAPRRTDAEATAEVGHDDATSHPPEVRGVGRTALLAPDGSSPQPVSLRPCFEAARPVRAPSDCDHCGGTRIVTIAHTMPCSESQYFDRQPLPDCAEVCPTADCGWCRDPAAGERSE